MKSYKILNTKGAVLDKYQFCLLYTSIVLEDGTKTTLRIEAEKDKVSPEEFTRRYNENAGKTPDEKIDNLHDEIEEEFGATSRNR